MKFTLRIWRQKTPRGEGQFTNYEIDGISDDTSFLEMIDILNERLEKEGKEPVAFDSDCREGICGACGLYINGTPHGPLPATTTCQLFMRHFEDGQTITVEPWRAAAFPVVKDLIVDRSAFDRIIQAGGYIAAPTGVAHDANSLPVAREVADLAFDAAACIGCGACVAACKNSSAALFVGAKLTHLAVLPQGMPNRHNRVLRMVRQMDAEGFGHCSNEGECEVACPKVIKQENISRMNREYFRAKLMTFFGGWTD